MERSAGIIVFRREGGVVQFLLIKNAAHGHWDFPKGHIDAGEDEMQAALREAREEAGLKELKIIPDFRVTIHYEIKSDLILIQDTPDPSGRYSRSEKMKQKEVIYFFAEMPPNTEVKLSSEHTEYGWFPLVPALEILQFENARRLLIEITKFLNK